MLHHGDGTADQEGGGTMMLMASVMMVITMKMHAQTVMLVAMLLLSLQI